MAKQTIVKNGVCVHSRLLQDQLGFIFSVLLFLLLESLTVVARPASEQQSDINGYQGEDDWSFAESFFPSSWLGVVVSLSFLIVLASLLALCGAGGCCGKIHWFGRARQEAPLSFSNPMSEPGSTMMVPISQIDVRALEMDPIVFEPLPTINDLTPVINNKASAVGPRSGHPLSNRNPVVPIIPFSDDNYYAHDWFEEPHNNFPRRNIEYVKEIGKGWFGQVIEAEARDIVPFAKKIRVIVKLLREDANGVEQMRFLDESRMYRDGDHGNILKLMGHSIEKLPFLLIMEYCPQGDLKSFLISNVIRAEMLNSQGTIVKMALDVAKGLEWLHNAGFAHQDLAARNCQVSSENRVVIGDYGLGTQNFKDDYHWSSLVAIPLRWTAPETLHCTPSVIQILKITETSNIWTLGVVIWEICEFGKLPYSELSDEEVISRVIVDKNYLLGQPSIPSMSAKEELYKIMSSCWQELEKRPRLYTIVRQLEELYSTFQTALPSTSKQVVPSIASPRDEFDSKWEQLAGRSNASEDDSRPRKKIVSFLDLEKQVTKKLDFDKSFASEEDSTYSEQFPKNDQNSEEQIVTDEPSSTSISTLDAKIELSKEADLDEEQWTKKIERGDITQKVMEKSQSVQDLMVLTHFEQNEVGDYDSLLFVAKSSLQGQNNSDQLSNVSSSTPSKKQEAASESGRGESHSNNSEANEGNSTLTKSQSESAIDSLSFTNSSHTLTPGSNGSNCESISNQAILNNSKNSSSSSPTPPASRLPNTLVPPQPPSINVIVASPTPSVEVNVIAPTPNKTSNTPPSSLPNQNGNGQPNSDFQNKKIHFKFDSIASPPSTSIISCPSSVVAGDGLNVPESRQRLTSTPRRSGSTPSPGVSDFGDEDLEGDNGDVFETNSGYYMDGTFSLSPISQSYVSVDSFNNSTIATKQVKGSSILLGACDDHELGSYQGVTSQLFDLQSKNNSVDLFGSDPKVIAETQSESDGKVPEGIKPRRIFFESPKNGNAEKVEEREESENKKVSNRNLSSVTSSAWDVESNTQGSMLTSSEEVNGSVLGTEENGENEKVTEKTEKNEATENGNPSEADDFWKMQLQSLQMAANSTRELVQSGLDEPVTSTSDKRFVEDIEQDVEELGSLVLHDLEEPESLQTVIRETRESLKSGENVSAAKLAFQGRAFSTGTSDNSCATNDPFETGFINATSTTDGARSHSAWSTSVWGTPRCDQLKDQESETVKTPDPSNEVEILAKNHSESEDEGTEGVEIPTDFVPSKWDNSLLPSRSAIKSPEQQPQSSSKSSGMRKSVSFEMKKTHLVYEYPPPPVHDDSDEDERKVTSSQVAPSTSKPATVNPLSLPLAASSLDWELTQEELEDAEINHEDWEEDVIHKPGDPMDVYRISGFNDDNFQVRCSNEPFEFSLPPTTNTNNSTPSSSTTLGELRHTRDKLRLDLNRGEANFLDDDAKSSSNPAKLDSGVGSSTNVSPFNTNCDILTKRNKNSD